MNVPPLNSPYMGLKLLPATTVPYLTKRDQGQGAGHEEPLVEDATHWKFKRDHKTLSHFYTLFSVYILYISINECPRFSHDRRVAQSTYRRYLVYLTKVGYLGNIPHSIRYLPSPAPNPISPTTAVHVEAKHTQDLKYLTTFPWCLAIEPVGAAIRAAAVAAVAAPQAVDARVPTIVDVGDARRARQLADNETSDAVVPADGRQVALGVICVSDYDMFREIAKTRLTLPGLNMVYVSAEWQPVSEWKTAALPASGPKDEMVNSLVRYVCLSCIQ